jgi:hypothetical protein
VVVWRVSLDKKKITFSRFSERTTRVHKIDEYVICCVKKGCIECWVCMLSTCITRFVDESFIRGGGCNNPPPVVSLLSVIILLIVLSFCYHFVIMLFCVILLCFARRLDNCSRIG